MSETSKDTESLPPAAAAVQRRNRLQLLGIMMIGFLTLGGSYLVFYLAQDSDGWGTTNNGTFVQPAISTQALGWQVEGNTRRWWLWVVSEDCADTCQQTIKHMQALHILLNREMDRVRRGYTALDQTVQSPEPWMTPYPALALIDVADPSPLTEGVYIVDPNGNLVFHYDMDTNPKLVLQDLKKLLKVSHIG
ncbi:MAG: hypothetical protein ACFHXK_01790 [bacterium]